MLEAAGYVMFYVVLPFLEK